MDPLAVPGVALVCAVDAAVRVVVFDAVLLPCVLQDTNAKLTRQRIRAAIRRASFKSGLLFLSLSWGRTDTNMSYACYTTWCITFLHTSICASSRCCFLGHSLLCYIMPLRSITLWS